MDITELLAFVVKNKASDLLAVIDAGDVLLVANLERSGEVRGVVANLRKRGRRNLL